MMEVKTTPNVEDDTIRKLYEASSNGCVSTLNTLFQRNPLILNRVSLSPFSETPLHIASLLGHLEFCQVLLQRKPSLASEVDSEGRCPLHLASAEGHTEVVKEDTKSDIGINCTSYGICEAGIAVLAYAFEDDFIELMNFNTASFYASLCVVLLLISGFPLKNKVMMWVLTIAMTVTVTFMGFTYVWAQSLVTPDYISSKVNGLVHPLAIVWGTILAVVGLIHAVRLVFWVRKTKKKKLHSQGNNRSTESELPG